MKLAVFVSNRTIFPREIVRAAGAALSRPGTVITLNGVPGAGKTVFARGFARKPGITGPVSSPTCTIVQEYNLPSGGRLYHLELYRISPPEAGLPFGVDEFLSGPEAVKLVECRANWCRREPAKSPSATPERVLKSEQALACRQSHHQPRRRESPENHPGIAGGTLMFNEPLTFHDDFTGLEEYRRQEVPAEFAAAGAEHPVLSDDLVGEILRNPAFLKQRQRELSFDGGLLPRALF